MEVPDHETVQAVDHNGRWHQVGLNELAWRPSAYAVLVRGETVLAIPHYDDDGEMAGYDLPGGGVDFGEHPAEAAIRETREETGLLVDEPRLLGLENTYFAITDEQRTVQALMLYYACRITGGDITNKYQEPWERQHTGDPEWLPIQALSQIAIASSADWRPYARQAGAVS